MTIKLHKKGSSGRSTRCVYAMGIIMTEQNRQSNMFHGCGSWSCCRYTERRRMSKASYDEQTVKMERFDKRIQELASQSSYEEKAKKLGCFLGIQTHTELSLLVETGNFSRFAKGSTYAAFLGSAPGEDSSGEKINRTGISKAGNRHLWQLLIEAARGICEGVIGYKSKKLRARQSGNTAEVIAYADRANTRLRSRYYKLIRHGKKKNVAVAAITGELVCFVCGGVMTDNTGMKIA